MFVYDNLIYHIYITLSEVIVSFVITMVISLIVSILIYESYVFDRVIEPFLTMFNSLPKVALGPLIIIILGAKSKSIIFMSVIISIITSIETISNGFKSTNSNMIKILKSFGSSEFNIIRYAVIPSNYKTIFTSLKVSMSLCLIGVIMGEFLTSKAGLGYLILYGGQVFNLTLVMSGILLLLMLSTGLYFLIVVVDFVHNGIHAKNGLSGTKGGEGYAADAM